MEEKQLKQVEKGCFIFIAIFFIGFIIAGLISKDLTPAEKRKQTILRQFNLDGSHAKINEYIKTRLIQPSSYEHIKSSCFDRGKYVEVNTTFCYTNKYGGKTRDTLTFHVSVKGELLGVNK